jgi:hypothetical protein
LNYRQQELHDIAAEKLTHDSVINYVSVIECKDKEKRIIVAYTCKNKKFKASMPFIETKTTFIIGEYYDYNYIRESKDLNKLD